MISGLSLGERYLANGSGWVVPKIERSDATEGHGTVGMENDFSGRGVGKIGRAVSCTKAMDLLIGGSEQAFAQMAGLEVAARNEDIDMVQNGLSEGQSVDFVEGVSTKHEDAQARISKPLHQVQERLGLLERFAAGEGDAFDGDVTVQDLAHHGSRVGFIAAVRVVRGRVETSRAIEGAPLEPHDGAQPRAVGPAGRFKCM